MAQGTCLLCGAVAALQDSHVLPAFVFRALKEHSATGHIRSSESPNRRVQDGVTQPWLCVECEASFSRWERDFSNNILRPWRDGVVETAYDDWLLKFCVSVSWRVLKYCKGRNEAAAYTDAQEKLFDNAERVWREFLLGTRAHPGEFCQQFLISDLIDTTTVRDLPDNINRFLMGAVSMDIVGSEHSAFTWAKMGRFQIFGVVQPGRNKFEGTKVHLKRGVLRPGRFVVPAGLLDLYEEKSTHISESMSGMSDVQFAKVESAFGSNLERARDSGQLAAMRADAALFGERVLLRRKRRSGSTE
jgi:hypothetical protein